MPAELQSAGTRQGLAQGIITAKQIFRELNAVVAWDNADWHSIGLGSLKIDGILRLIVGSTLQRNLCFFGPLPHKFLDKQK